MTDPSAASGAAATPTTSAAIVSEGGSGGGSGLHVSVDPVRVSVEEVMEEEWEIMRTENRDLPQITPRRKRASSMLGLGSCKRQQPCVPAFSDDREYEV